MRNHCEMKRFLALFEKASASKSAHATQLTHGERRIYSCGRKNKNHCQISLMPINPFAKVDSYYFQKLAKRNCQELHFQESMKL